MISFQRVGDQTDILGESPVWDDRRGVLFWVDIRRGAIRRLDSASGAITSWPAPVKVGCIALSEDGRLLVALGNHIVLWSCDDGSTEVVASLPERIRHHRFNDGACDRQGRFWVGTMHNLTRAPEGRLYRLDGDRLTPVLSAIRIPNSLAWSPDGRTMYFSDSLDYSIDAFEFAPADGAVGPARTFARTSAPAFPDGSTVDAEGYLWNAEFNGGRVVRYRPDGSVDRVLETPVERPTSCTFGGTDLDTLFVTSTSQNMSPAELAAHPLAGGLFAAKVDVRGLPEPRFAPAAVAA